MDNIQEKFIFHIYDDNLCVLEKCLDENAKFVNLKDFFGKFDKFKIEDFAFARCKNIKGIYLPKNTECKNNIFGIKELNLNSRHNRLEKTYNNIYIFLEGNSREMYKKINLRKINGKRFIYRGRIQSVNYFEDGLYDYYVANDEIIINKCNDELLKCADLESYFNNKSIREISPYAFENFRDLKEIVFQDDILTIGEYAFSGCESIEKINLPASLYDINKAAFSYCVNLKHIEFNKELSIIGENAFKGCVSIEKLCLQGNDLTVEEGAFSACFGLKEVYMNNTVKEIEDKAFSGCINLRNAYVYSILDDMYPSSFDDTPCLVHFHCRINEFFKMISLDENYICHKLIQSSIIYFNNKKLICKNNNGFYSFNDEFDKIYALIIPEKYIENIDFYKYDSLDIYNDRFNSIENIIVEEYNERYGSLYKNVLVDNYTNTLIKGCKNSIITNDIKHIGTRAFISCDFEYIEIPYGIETIKYQAFYNCKNLSIIKLPSSLIKIENYAFKNCNIKKVIMSASLDKKIIEELYKDYEFEIELYLD